MLLPPGSYGYISITEPGKTTVERDAYLCCHCQEMCIIVPGSGKTRGYCYLCFAPTCGQKRCSERCVPFEAKLEAMEGRRRFYKQLELDQQGEPLG